jgi:hypothetical protein
MKITKQDKENLIWLLKDYLLVYKKRKKHPKNCPDCRLAKEFLKKFIKEKMKKALKKFLYYSSLILLIATILVVTIAIFIKAKGV